MHRILSANLSLPEHIAQMAHAPEVYRLPACPHCDLCNPWMHGYYQRKADRSVSSAATLNPVLVPRFCCRGCGRTSSRLPLAIAPRRWHPWAAQQRVLMSLLAGASLRQASALAGIVRRTARRWWHWLKERSLNFSFILRSRFPELGRSDDELSFWRTCLAAMPLAEAMAWIDREVAVP